MKSNQTLSVAIVALLGLASANIPQHAPAPISHPVNNAHLAQAQTHVVESKPPASNAHVQLQQTQQVNTLADKVIYAKSHIGGGAKLDKDDRHTTLTIVQDFPKKKPDSNQIHNIEMLQSHEQIHQQQAIQITSQVHTQTKQQAHTQVKAAKKTAVVQKTAAVQKAVAHQTVKANVETQNKAVAVTVNHQHMKSRSKNIDEGLKSMDDNSAKKITLTVVQDFRKKSTEKPVEKSPLNMEMVQQKEHEQVNINEKEKKLTTQKTKDNKSKTTTLTIVQEFPKKKVDLEKAPEATEMINHKQEINMNNEKKPAHHKQQSFLAFEFVRATDFLWKAFGFGK